MFIGDLRIHADTDALIEAVAQRWVAIAGEAVNARGKFHVALSGGTTPRALYRLLALPKFSDRVPWDQVHVYFGDERTVPPDHSDSNFHMAKETLFDHVPIPPSHIHRIQGELEDPHAAASEYTRALTSNLPLSAQGVVQFDLLLLGVGSDGHIASLFPATPVLYERARLVEAVYVETMDTWRITLTLPVIDHARHVLILVSGAAKAPIMRDVFATQPTPPFPVQLINPLGILEWHLDQAAAGLLPEELRS
ncbi:MAG: 6-phosphogluconolactonase [Gammaproteobacteria bacterium]|jgi:6-phosphogluconolactonase